jgi:TolB-like protein
MGIVAATVVATAALSMFMGRDGGTSRKAAVREATHTIAVLPFVDMSPDRDQ